MVREVPGYVLFYRVSYYEIKVNDYPSEKHKSSGIAICTGTGSTSWFYHINNLPLQAIKTVLGYGKESVYQRKICIVCIKMAICKCEHDREFFLVIFSTSRKLYTWRCTFGVLLIKFNPKLPNKIFLFLNNAFFSLKNFK